MLKKLLLRDELSKNVKSIIEKEIIERKSLEMALEEYEKKYTTFTENKLIGVIVYQNRRLIFANRTFSKMTGYSIQELLNFSYDNIQATIHPDDSKIVLESTEKFNKGKQISPGHKYRILRKDDTYIWVEAFSNIIEHMGERALQVLYIDITSEKEALINLQESEAKYESIIRVAPVGIGVVVDRAFSYLGNSFLEMIGYTYDELIGKNARIIYPNEEEYIRVGRKKYAEIEKFGIGSIHTKWKHKDGTIIEVDLRSTALDSNDHSKGMMFTATDISEAKRAEEELRLSERKYQNAHQQLNTIINSLNHPFYVINAEDYTIQYMNSATNQIFKGTMATNTCYGITHNRIEPCSGEDYPCPLENVKAFKKPFSVKHRHLSTDGKYETFEIHAHPIFDNKGNVIQIIEYSMNTSDREKAEKAQLESEEKYRLIIETTQEGIWLIDQEEKITFVNHQLSEMLGYSVENMINHSIFDFMDKNNHTKAKLLFNRIKRGLKESFDFQFYRRDGTIFWGLVYANPVLKEGGKFSGILGMVRDITERKQREEKTRKQLMKFNVEEGYIYLVTESSPILSVSVFEDLSRLGYIGLVFSRTSEKEFKKNLEADCDFLWLAKRGKENYIQPELGKITTEIEKLPQKSLILIDRFDYLIQKNGFKNTLNLVYELKEIAHILDLIILISLDANTLTDQELSLIRKETRLIEPRSLERVSEDVLEILRFVYVKNNSGLKPAYSDIGNELQISRPTTRKRIKTLLATGYLTEYRFGIRKVLEVTEKGRNLFMK